MRLASRASELATGFVHRRAAARPLALLAALLVLSAWRAPAGAQIPPLGDVNCDQSVDAADIGALIDVIFGAPNRCSRADVNGDGAVSIADSIAVQLLIRPDVSTRTPTPTITGAPTTVAASATPTVSAPTSTRTTTPTLSPASPTSSATRTATVPATATNSPTPTDQGSLTPTATRSATDTPSPTATASATETETATPTLTTTGSQPPIFTRTRTPTPSTTPSNTRTPSRTSTPSITPTPSFTVTITFTQSPTRTSSVTTTPSITRTFTLTRTPSPTPTLTYTSTVPATLTPTRSNTVTRTPTLTRTPSATPTITPSPTITRTATATPTLGMGPQITFFGLARADGGVLTPNGITPGGDPIYIRNAHPDFGGAFGFLIVVEARAGAGGSPPGNSALNSDPSNPGARPDLQIEVNRSLGNGSAEVCDKGSTDPDAPPPGGVPAINPPSYDPGSQMVADAMNDLACRFDHNAASSNACTVSSFGNFRFASDLSSNQFCSQGPVDFGFRFPQGDTLMTVRWRDFSGVLGSEARLVIRVP